MVRTRHRANAESGQRLVQSALPTRSVQEREEEAYTLELRAYEELVVVEDESVGEVRGRV